MIVISDASPLINLAFIGHLTILKQLYHRVVIPQAVFDEIARAGAGLPGSQEVQTSDWITTHRLTDPKLGVVLRLELDDGEAEAIALAVEMRADLLLLDERKGRAIAAKLGLRFIGLLGVLVEAKQQGLVPAIKPLLDELIGKAGFWVSEDLYRQILQTVGE